MITKVETSQTPQGYKIGDAVKTLPFLQIDGNHFPVISATVTKIETVTFDDKLTFCKVSLKCKRNPQHWNRMEIDSIHLQ
jgi:hypothetical protein